MTFDLSIDNLITLANEVREASYADTKTPLQNSLSLEKHGKRLGQGKSPYSIVVFGDLNGFKQINDENSHAAGDDALNKVGETMIERIVNPLDALAFRPSGDEFVVLLKGDSINEFLNLAKSFGRVTFSHQGRELAVGMSFGYAFSDPLATFDDLLSRAEFACQNAKLKGNGFCVLWSKEMEDNPVSRINGTCKSCEAKVICSMPRRNAPSHLKYCPNCGGELSST
jgi:diguanylate cyclase (GGDEF)-like protein